MFIVRSISPFIYLAILSLFQASIVESTLGQTGTKSSSDADELASLWTRKKGNDWPSFLGPNRDGISSETGILKDWSNGNLKVIWSIETGQGYGIGSVSCGRYLHFDRADESARLRCLNAETGKQLWEYTYPSNYTDLYAYDSGPRASPVIDGNRVYVLGVEGKLVCLNATDGTKIWQVDTGERFTVVQNFFGVGSTPTVFKDLLLVMVGGSKGKQRVIAPGEFPNIKPDGSAVVAFDKFSGDVKYKSGNDLASYSSIKLTEIGGQPIALVWARKSLLGLEPETGEISFQVPWRARILESANASTPVSTGEFVFVSECYGKGGLLLKFKNGLPWQIWSDEGKRKKSLATHWNTPVLHEGFLYASSGRHSGDAELRCIELETGQVRWAQRGLARSSATYVDGHLIVLGEYGKILLVRATPEKFDVVTELDPNDGIKLNYPCWSAPIVAHGLMLVRGKKKVVCYDLIPE